MGQQTTDVSQQEAEIISSIIPAEVNANPDAAISQDILQSSTSFGQLSDKQLSVLTLIADGVMSEDNTSDSEIHRKTGIARDTIARYRRDPVFNRALAVIIREVVKGNVDNLVAGLYRHGRKNYKALELLLKYSGQYTERHANLNVNANVSVDTAFTSSGDAIEAFFIRLGELGWNAQRCADTFEKLRREGAF